MFMAKIKTVFYKFSVFYMKNVDLEWILKLIMSFLLI